MSSILKDLDADSDQRAFRSFPDGSRRGLRQQRPKLVTGLLVEVYEYRVGPSECFAEPAILSSVFIPVFDFVTPRRCFLRVSWQVQVGQAALLDFHQGFEGLALFLRTAAQIW